MAGSLERLNLNIPRDARARLRRLAEAADEAEAVYARELLLLAIDQAERNELKHWLKARPAELVARERQIATAIETLRGRPR